MDGEELSACHCFVLRHALQLPGGSPALSKGKRRFNIGLFGERDYLGGLGGTLKRTSRHSGIRYKKGLSVSGFYDFKCFPRARKEVYSQGRS